MKPILKIYFFLILFAVPHVILAKVDTVSIQSTVFQEKRTVLISLPSNYEREAFFDFPVVYLTDASSQMDHTQSMIHYLSGSISPMIIVGVDTPNRFDELSPYANGQQTNVKKLHEFIAKEVKPYIEQRYRTAPFSILSGHSLGGAFTLYSYLYEPNAFSAYVALAPTLAFGNEVLLEQLKALPEKQLPSLQVFFEGQSQFDTPKRSFQALFSIMNNHAASTKAMQVEILDKEDHMTVAHLGMYQAVRTLYKDWFLSIPELLNKEKGFDRHFKQLSHRLNYHVKPTENELWQLVQALLGAQKFNPAKEVADHAFALYPNSHSSFDLQALVAKHQGREGDARKLWEKAIKLASDDVRRVAHYREKINSL